MVIRGRYRGTSVLMAACVSVALTSWPASAAQSAAAPQAPPRWHVVKTIKQAGLKLIDVVGVRGGRAWVSGGQGTSLSSSPIFYHWTGAKWMRIPRPGISPDLVFAASLSASSDGNVWGALANGGAVDHWNGHAWTRFTFGTSATAAVGGVAAVGRHLGVAVTHDFNANTETAFFYTGTTFNPVSLPATVTSDSEVNAVSASSRSNIWAWAITPVGFHWEALHFTGTTWRQVRFPSALVPHNGGPAQMLAESPTNVWATISGPSQSLTKPIELVHWNGTRWQLVRGSHRPVGNLPGPIAPDGRGGLWLYAQNILHGKVHSFFVHYRNGAFSTQAAPTSPLGTVSISAIALIPGTSSLYGVGAVTSAENSVGGLIIKFGG